MAPQERALSEAFLGGYADTMYLMIVGILVFFMQCGFAMLEAGTVRAKNTKNILLKNMLDACIGALIWWSIGYGIAYDGNNPFIGTSEGPDHGAMFFLKGFTENEDPTGYAYAMWWFQYVFAAAAATIVSGAMAERTTLTGYMAYTSVITAFIYPVVVHWGWSPAGWLSPFNADTGDKANFNGGMIDFAGSGIVHMTGGVCAIVGASVIGPRKGRFDENKQPIEMAGHSTTLSVLGTFILWVGWYGFNPGSTLGISAENYARDAARCVVTTTLSAASGGITVLLVNKLVGNKMWDISMVCNGVLAGLVSITAGCASVLPWAAFMIGIIGGIVYFTASKMVLKVCKVDDPLDAFAVHGACGFWGVIAVALWATPYYTYNRYGTAGLFYGQADLLGAAVVGLIAIIAWTASMSALVFVPLKMLGVLRVSADVEEIGMDVSKHGGSAYPTAA